MLWIRETPDGAMFKVAIQPRGSKNEIVGLHGDAVKIKLTAPPVEGAANKMCVVFLAKRLNVPPSAVEIVQGHRSRFKTVLVRSMTKAAVEGLLLNG
jgi:uncharacterized protein (TIGR00251 family)